jgi:hypothetical protein
MFTPTVEKSDSLDHIDAVVVEHGIGFGNEIVQNSLALGMFKIDGKG